MERSPSVPAPFRNVPSVDIPHDRPRTRRPEGVPSTGGRGPVRSALRTIALIAAIPHLFFFSPAVHGQEPRSGDPASPRLEVHLLTIDQGDAVWEKFGHNALLIRDLATGQEIAWNWGLFDFGDADFIPRFLRGSMLYTMGPVDPQALLASYVRSDRSVYSNRVNLTETEAEALDRMVWENYEPEDRDYTYHYFLDNCSTRVRDALDRVLGGALRERFAERETDRSFRWHSRRLVQGTTWIDQGLSFLLGARGDVPRTEWDAMFVPMELMRLLEEVERTDGDRAGEPLLGPREVLFRATRDATPAGPPPFSPVWPLLGLAYGAGLVLLGARSARGSRSARWALAGATAGWAAFSAVFGGILLGAWFTDHDFIQWNLNLLYVSPIGILLAPVALATLLPEERGGRRARGLTVRLSGAVALLALVAVAAEATPLVGQGNGEVVGVALPIDLALAWATVTAFGGGFARAPNGRLRGATGGAERGGVPGEHPPATR